MTFCVSGSVPTEERETKASSIAGQALRKNVIGLTLPTSASSTG